MKQIKLITSIALLALCMISCNNSKQTNATVSQTDSLDVSAETAPVATYYGTYEGVLPTANAAGVRTVLVVNEDNTFTLKSEYIGKGDSGRFEDVGNYSVNNNVITLTDNKGKKLFYRIDDGKVSLCDPDGNVASPEMADKYSLMKKI